MLKQEGKIYIKLNLLRYSPTLVVIQEMFNEH